jgi:hypothetical protein
MTYSTIESSIILENAQVERLNALVTRTTLSHLMILSKIIGKRLTFIIDMTNGIIDSM